MIKANPFPKSIVYTILEESWEALDCDAILLIDALDLLTSELIILRR